MFNGHIDNMTIRTRHVRGIVKSAVIMLIDMGINGLDVVMAEDTFTRPSGCATK